MYACETYIIFAYSYTKPMYAHKYLVSFPPSYYHPLILLPSHPSTTLPYVTPINALSFSTSHPLILPPSHLPTQTNPQNVIAQGVCKTIVA